jgi:hypothetical protein
MKNDRRLVMLLIVGLLVIFSALATQWFYTNFEYKEVEKTTTSSAEARRNKFLAAEYYLRELGFEVESDSNRARLLETHKVYQTVFINDYGPKLSPTYIKELKAWIENGGHLILTANEFQYRNYEDAKSNEYIDYDFKNNQLLNEYGIQAYNTNYYDYKAFEKGNNPSHFLLSDGSEVSINFSPYKELIDSNDLATFSLNDAYGCHLLQLDIGKGKLTVLSDNNFLSNNNIGENDHAYLLTLLSGTERSADKKILLLYNNQSDSIITLIWRHGKHACIAFLMLLILSLWSMRNRLGPILPLINFSNRNITEHLHAIARFSWRQDHGKHLLNQSRLACENALLKRYPVLKSMSTQERLDHISDILDMATEKVHSALYYEPKSTNEYINSSHNLQKLWIVQ